MKKVLIVAAVFHATEAFPGEDDTFGVEDGELAWDEAWVAEFCFGDLSFAAPGAHVGAPSDSAAGNMVIAGDFDSFEVVAALVNADDFIEMAGVITDPFARQIGLLRNHT